MAYFIRAGTPVRVARVGEATKEHETQSDQNFSDEELVAGDIIRVPAADDTSPAALWARRGYFVFKRGDWFLIAESYHVDIEF